MPEIEEIDDEEAQRVEEEELKRKQQEQIEAAKVCLGEMQCSNRIFQKYGISQVIVSNTSLIFMQALAEADRRRKVDEENQAQKAARLKRIEEQKKKTQELLNKIGKVELEDDEEDLLFKMPEKPDVVDPGLGYEIFISEEKGRGIKATKDFNVGNLILQADPFAYVIFENMAEHVCHHCFNMVIRDKSGKPTTTLLKCSACKFARYCSRDCQKKAWPMHKKECMAIKVRNGFNYAIMLLRNSSYIIKKFRESPQELPMTRFVWFLKFYGSVNAWENKDAFLKNYVKSKNFVIT